MLQLTHFPLCPHSRSIRLALGELQCDAHMVIEKPWAWRPEFLAVNPSGELPVLLVDEILAVCGAYAIAEYLGEQDDIGGDGDGTGPALFPGNVEERAEVRRLVDWFQIKCDREVTRPYLREKYYVQVSGRPRQTPNSNNLRSLSTNLRYHLRYIGYLADNRRWLAGDDLSFADLAAAAHLSSLDYLGLIVWDDFPSARMWYVRMKSRPAFQPLLGDRLPGKTPPPHYPDVDF